MEDIKNMGEMNRKGKKEKKQRNGKYPQFYTLGEEVANAVTHGVAAALAVAAAIVLIVFAANSGDSWIIVSSCVYSFSMVVLFTMSTLYHSFPVGKCKAVFRIFDHASIFILIAGSYTPFTLVTIRGTLGWVLFGIVWGSAVIGITLNAINLEKFDKFSLCCYLASGWCIVFAIRPMMRVMQTGGLVLLVLGGLAYTFGVIFYASKNKYMHCIWHIFVLAGAAFHYFAVLFYVVLA